MSRQEGRVRSQTCDVATVRRRLGAGEILLVAGYRGSAGGRRPGEVTEVATAAQRPVAEKCMGSGLDQSPPHFQPIAANAEVTTSPAAIIPGRAQVRSR
jgi:hypothetical protein